MRRLLMKLLPAVFAIGTVVSAPFVLPKIQHLLPGPEESTILPNEVEMAESDNVSEEYSSDIFLQKATVQRVIDGDTMIVDTDEESSMRIRFIGMDTPESVHPDESKNTNEGAQAAQFTEALIPPGTILYLEADVSDTDRYDRYLRYVWLTDDLPEVITVDFIRENMVNALLIDEGIAELATFKPDTKYVNVFQTLAHP